MTQFTDAPLTLALAAGPAGGAGGGLAAFLTQFGPIILIVVVFFWLMHRSQKKKDQERHKMLDSIEPKDRVVTIGGIHGRVVEVREDVFVLRVDENVKIAVSKSAVSRKASEQPDEQLGV